MKPEANCLSYKVITNEPFRCSDSCIAAAFKCSIECLLQPTGDITWGAIVIGGAHWSPFRSAAIGYCIGYWLLMSSCRYSAPQQYYAWIPTEQMRQNDYSETKECHCQSTVTDFVRRNCNIYSHIVGFGCSGVHGVNINTYIPFINKPTNLLPVTSGHFCMVHQDVDTTMKLLYHCFHG